MSLGTTQSAQALRPNQVQHAFGLEWFRVDGGSVDFPLPFPMPFYTVRVGLSEGVDLGFRTNATFSTIGVDLKVQLVDGEHVDLAVDPTVSYGWVWGWAQMPVLVGLWLGESVQLQLGGRVGYVLPLLDDRVVFDELSEAFGRPGQAIAGGGAAVYLRLGDRLAIVPEVQAVRGFGETDPLVISFTMGFTLGDQPGGPSEAEPDHEDTRSSPQSPATPSAGYPPEPRTRPSGPPPDVRPTLPPGYGEPVPE